MNIISRFSKLVKRRLSVVQKNVTCPKRLNQVGPWEHKENIDAWEDRYGIIHCNFCGSVHPDYAVEFCKHVDDNQFVEVADNKSKMYLNNIEKGIHLKFYFAHFWNLPEDVRAKHKPVLENAIELGRRRLKRMFALTTRGGSKG
jgi:hypothetical protein